MKLFNFVPNFLTLTNLFFGCIAVVFGVMGDLEKLARVVEESWIKTSDFTWIDVNLESDFILIQPPKL